MYDSDLQRWISNSQGVHVDVQERVAAADIDEEHAENKLVKILFSSFFVVFLSYITNPTKFQIILYTHLSILILL